MMSRIRLPCMSLLPESSSAEESNGSPQLPQQCMNKQLKVWLDLGLAEFMTTDHLFTIMLLRAYHSDCKIRKVGVQRVLEHAYRLQNDAALREVVGEYSNMPFYSELVRWIDDTHLKSVQNTNSPIRTLKSQPAYEKPRDLEQAAAATVFRPYKTGKPLRPLPLECMRMKLLENKSYFAPTDVCMRRRSPRAALCARTTVFSTSVSHVQNFGTSRTGVSPTSSQ